MRLLRFETPTCATRPTLAHVNLDEDDCRFDYKDSFLEILRMLCSYCSTQDVAWAAMNCSCLSHVSVEEELRCFRREDWPPCSMTAIITVWNTDWPRNIDNAAMETGRHAKHQNPMVRSTR